MRKVTCRNLNTYVFQSGVMSYEISKLLKCYVNCILTGHM